MPCARALAAVFLSAVVLAAVEAAAQTPPPADAAKAMLGTREISNADRDKICLVTFRPEPAPGGLKLEFDKACVGAFPLIKGVAAWTIDASDTLRLVDAKGKAVLELSEVEDGMFQGERPGEGIYFLQNPAPASNVALTADQMTGDWGVMRDSDHPICVVTLSKATAKDGFALHVKPGCDPFVSTFNPSSWRLDRGELVLSSARGGSWRFEAADAETWHRIPESTDSVLLVRQ